MKRIFHLAIIFTVLFQLSACGGTFADPTVISITPADEATDVGLNTLIIVIFSKIIAAPTVDNEAFVVTAGPAGEVGTEVAGSFAVNGTTVTFTPDAELDPNTRYQVDLNSDIKDLDGNGLDNDVTTSFTTGDGT